MIAEPENLVQGRTWMAWITDLASPDEEIRCKVQSSRTNEFTEAVEQALRRFRDEMSDTWREV